MDDDLFQFEAAPEVAPELILGKKKKKKKKKKDVDEGGPSDQPSHTETGDAPSLDDDSLPALDLGKSKKKKKKDKPAPSNGHSSAFGALEDDGDEHIDPQPSATAPTSAFAALDLDPDADAVDDGADADADDAAMLSSVSGKKKKGKKKKPLTLDPIEADDDAHEPNPDATQQNVSVEEEVKRPLTAAEKKKAKKERERLAKQAKSKKDEEDIDAIMAELGGPSTETPNPAPSVSANVEKAAAAQDVGVDDLFAELVDDAPVAKKKSKKKKKKAADTGPSADPPEDDVDALLSSLTEGNDDKSGAVAPVETGAPSTTGDDIDDLMAEFGVDDGPSKAKSKKKKKKKAGAKAEDGEGAVTEAPAVPTATGKKKKKESAAVRMMRERQEKRQAEEDRLRKLQEEEEARIAAEEKRRQDEARKKEEEKARKKAAEKAKRERKRQDGTLLSKAEKERRRKAEAFKKQLMESGMAPGAAKSGDADASGQERSVPNRRRRNVRDKSQRVDDAQPPGETAEQPETVDTSKEQDAPKDAAVPVPEPVEKVIPDAWDAEEEPEEEAEVAEHVVGTKATETKAPTSTPKSETRDVGKPVTAAGEEEPEEDDDSEEDDSESDSDSDDYEGMSKAEIDATKRVSLLRKKRSKQKEDALAARTPDRLRSPIICILGHVDTGKTKILDKIRRTNVQDGEAGGITQQIGATYFPIDAVMKEATKLKEGRELEYNVPSLLIIDTPGHESFTNLRSRGSSLCDIAILVVDIMHGLEPQTRESIDLLKLRKTPFIVALNKIDRIYDWQAQPNNCPSQDSLGRQRRHAREEFHRRVKETQVEFSEIGFNTALYWENDDIRRTISLVPTSAITGEGIPDMLMLLLALPQKLLTNRLMFNSVLEATVLEVKVIEGLGTTIDIILTGGTIHEGDTIMVMGLDGPITTAIRALLTPHPMKEMRVKGQYLHHKKIEAAQGIKISADGLEKAVAGTQLMVVQDPNDEDELEYVRDEVMKDFNTILTRVDRSGVGVYVQASTLGSLEALLEFLRTSKIPVSGINIGPVHKRDVTKASAMLERQMEYATILAFDVSVEKEARELAEETGVRIFTADIIYHLFDQFTVYMEETKVKRREEASDDVVFPSISKILPQHVYNKRDPIVVGVDVMEGILRVGTPLVVKKAEGGWLDIGRVASIELNKKQVVTAKKGESVAIKIQDKATEKILYGRHFDFQDALVSKMTRNAIELLKQNFRDDLDKTDWKLVVKLKDMLRII